MRLLEKLKMDSTMVLFAGQGSQYQGMGHNMSSLSDIVLKTLQEADEALGFKLSDILADGPEELLAETAITQPAILTVGVVQWRLLQERLPGFLPMAAAGHSLGEYGALVVAESLAFDDALRLVHLRGRAMQEAVPIGVGAMAAILGLEGEQVAALCREVAEDQVLEVAGLNCPGQTSVAGHTEAVGRLILAAEDAGARSASLLKVSAPFHCALLGPAADRLEEAVSSMSVKAPRCPVLQNVNALPTVDPEQIRHNLVAQVTRPVLWEAILRRSIHMGAELFLELGPGRTLAGMMRRVDRHAEVFSLDRSDFWI